MRKRVNTTMLGVIVLGLFAFTMIVSAVSAFLRGDAIWVAIGLAESATAIYLAAEAVKWVRIRKKVTNFLIDTPAASIAMILFVATNLLEDHRTTGTTFVTDWVSLVIWGSLLVIAVTVKLKQTKTVDETATV